MRDEGLHVSGRFSSGVSKTILREQFKSFNAMFEDVHKTQALWLILDTRLRGELRIFISNLLIPAYRSFLGRFRSHIQSGKHPENYIKCSVEHLESTLLYSRNNQMVFLVLGSSSSLKSSNSYKEIIFKKCHTPTIG